MDVNLMKRAISLLLCAVLLLGNFPVTVRAEETLPECDGGSECAAESHAEGCEKAAADKAAADQAAADAVDALVETLPALADIQAKPMAEAGDEYAQVNAAYDAYMALTDDQKALLAYGEELFLPYLQYFSGAPQETAETSGSCGENVTWSFDSGAGKLTIFGEGEMANYDTVKFIPWYSYLNQIKAVEINNGVTSIGSLAFWSCTNLTSIKIPDSVTSIGESAFVHCGSLKSISIPDNIINIGTATFKNCSSLTSISIPGSVTSIGSSAFEGCSGLTNVTIPDSVTSIGYSAFSYCNSLTEISISDSVTSIGLGAFSKCVSLVSISIPDGVASIDDSMFSYCSNLQSVMIPDSVTNIGNKAFYGCDSLSNIVLPNDVTSIGNEAFAYCDNLISITIPNRVKSIENAAFYGCEKVTDVYYGGTETQWNAITIGSMNTPLLNANKHYTDPCADGHSYGTDNICTNCGAVDRLDSGMCGENLTWTLDKNGLLTISGTGAMADISVDSVPWKTWKSDIQFVVIGEGITNIPYGAFYECKNLKTVSIPASVNSVEDNFPGCNSLEAINVAADNLNYCSADGVLFTKDMTELIKYPPNKPDMEYTVPDTVTALRIQSFMGSKNLVSIVLPDDITSLTLGIFLGCTALKDIKLPKNLKNIEGSDNFTYCTGLERIELPENLENTGFGTFKHCINLKEVVLPKNLKTIDGDVFQECVSLERLVVPENVTSMGMALFFTIWEGSSAALKEIVFQGNAPEFFATNDTFAGVTATAYYPAGNPTWTETVKQNYSGTITWKPYCPDDEHEFEQVVDEKYLVTAATCTSVAVYKKSCLYCGLASTTETFIGGDPDYTNHNYVSGVCARCALPEGLIYEVNNGEVIITDYTGTATSVEIPATIEGKSVTGIGESAFESCLELTDITIPDSVTSLGVFAFRGSYALESVKLPDGITKLPSSLFWVCTSLTSVDIPESVQEIGDAAFYGCSSLTSINIPEGVTTIGQNAFMSCSSLESIELPSTVTDIGLFAFEGCISLQNIRLPDGITNIPMLAFSNCVKLTSISIPGSVEAIDSLAFAGSENLTDIYYGGTVEQWAILGEGAPAATFIHYSVMDPSNHWAVDNKTPTCVDDGYTREKCACGYIRNEMPKPATEEHSFGTKRGSLKTAGTCVAEAVYAVKCDNCSAESETKTVKGELDPDNHTGVNHTENAKNATCTEEGYTGDTVCECGETVSYGQAIKQEDHSYDSVVTPPTCTEKGYATYTCSDCGDSFVDTYVDPLKHTYGEWTVSREATPAADGEEVRTCTRCSRSESRAVEHVGNVVAVSASELLNVSSVWLDGVPCTVKQDGETCYIDIPEGEFTNVVSYSYNAGDGSDVHTQYPTGMRVWRLTKNGDGSYSATYVPELENILQYSGSSIRITGTKGIRMITSITESNKAALTGGNLAGYKLLEYGTALCWASDLEGGNPMVLGQGYVKSNYAYKRGVADPVFAKAGGLVQYTNVLVGFNLDQCKDDIAMRPYIILEDANGETITIYGGIVYRSIGYIAYQNRNVFKAGTGSYNYVWEIIHHVYGDKYDADYKG